MTSNANSRCYMKFKWLRKNFEPIKFHVSCIFCIWGHYEKGLLRQVLCIPIVTCVPRIVLHCVIIQEKKCFLDIFEARVGHHESTMHVEWLDYLGPWEEPGTYYQIEMHLWFKITQYDINWIQFLFKISLRYSFTVENSNTKFQTVWKNNQDVTSSYKYEIGFLFLCQSQISRYNIIY